MSRPTIPNPTPPPWPNPPQIPPGGPCATPTAAQRTEARLRLARYDGNLDRQANATLGVLQADVGLIATHLETHLGCDRACPALAGLVRSAGAASAAFDAADVRARELRRAA